jgi:hypothetical protein
MNDVTAKVRAARKPVNLSLNSHDGLSAYAKDKRLNITQVVESLIEWLPVYELCNKQELSIEAAIIKLSATHTARVWDKSDKPVTSKTLDKFSYWLEKLYNHNENSTLENRVFITQRLLLNVTGGNVNMISAACKERANEITAHNERMNVNDSTNRKLSSRIREEYGTVADWLLKILG